MEGTAEKCTPHSDFKNILLVIHQKKFVYSFTRFHNWRQVHGLIGQSVSARAGLRKMTLDLEVVYLQL